MNKKAITILGGIFILIVGTLGVVIYLRSRTDNSQLSEQPEVIEDPVIEEIPEDPSPEENSSSSTATKLIDDAVVTPALFFQGDGIAYFNKQGQLFRTKMSVAGGSVLLSDKTQLTVPPRSNLNKILWPPVGNSYIAESGTGVSRQWAYYNPDTAEYIDLPSQIKSLVWMPNGTQIMYTWVGADGKTTLNVASPDAKNYQTLTPLFDPDYNLHISPDGQKVLFYRTMPTDLTRNQITQVTSDGKTFTAVVRDGFNKGVLWSPDSKKFLFTKRDPFTQKFDLWFYDFSTGAVKNLGVSTEEIKAVWTKDSQEVIAAAPKSDGTGDMIYLINPTTNERTEFDPGSSVSAEELFLSLNEDVLFFKNIQDSSLYYLIIK